MGVVMKKSNHHWSIIPSMVRRDNSLMAEAKLLYGDILGLSGTHGYCWAKSGYLEEVSGLSDRQILRALKNLEDHGYINREGGGGSRKIYPLMDVTATKTAEYYDNSGVEDYDENGGHINTVIINTNTTTGGVAFEEVRDFLLELHAPPEYAEHQGRIILEWFAEKDKRLTKQNYKRYVRQWWSKDVMQEKVKPVAPPVTYTLSEIETVKGAGLYDESKFKRTGKDEYMLR